MGKIREIRENFFEKIKMKLIISLEEFFANIRIQFAKIWSEFEEITDIKLMGLSRKTLTIF